VPATQDDCFPALPPIVGSDGAELPWRQTPFGDPAAWSDALRSAVGLIERSGFPMFLVWGDERRILYNQAYRPILADRHPSAQGKPFFDVWPRTARMGHVLEDAFAGEAAFFENLEVLITRRGEPEQAWFTFSFSPVRGAGGSAPGVLCVCAETTQQALAERASRAAQQRLERMFERAPAFICIMEGPDHVFTFTNQTHRRFFGRDVTGHPVREAFPELERQGHIELLDRVRATGERVSGQGLPILVQPDPSAPPREMFADFIYEPIVDETGQVHGIFCQGSDVTEATTERLAREASEAKLRLAIDAGQMAIWSVDARGEVEVTPEFLRLLHLPVDSRPTLQELQARYYPGELERVQALGAEAFARGDHYLAFEYRHLWPDDEVRWLLVRAELMRSQAGEPLGAIGVVIDITDRKTAQERNALMLELSDLLSGPDTDLALQEASALMGRFFGASRVGYGHLDPVEDVFDYAACWTDGTVPPLIGQFPAAAFGKRIVAKLTAGETVVVADLQADPVSDDPDTRATAEAVNTRAILVVPFVRAGRLRTIVYLNDRRVRRWSPSEIQFMEELAERTRQVIERSEAEQALHALNATLEARVEERTAALRSAEEALRQSQKMEAIGQLTGGIAHDFNNLLQGISGSLAMMERRLEEGRPDALGRFIAAAKSSAERAAALTHRLLAFSRRQPLDPRPVRANLLILSMQDLLKRAVGETIDLELNLADELWPTVCDANQLENALLNAAINSRDAMPDGGKLVIATANVQVDKGLASQGEGLAPGRFIRITVEDTGTGMSPEALQRAFEPFFTTKPMGQGTGLGLSMIYGFARQSNGHVEITSQLGRGTTLAFYLPHLDAPASLDDLAPSRPAAGDIGGAGVVLVVEDEPVVRDLVVNALRELGYTPLEASDGSAGVEVMGQSDHIDLLITDVGLPGLNGRQVADWGRQMHPAMKVLFMTGYAENAAMAPGMLEPGMALITKPFALEVLAARVRELLGAEAIP
jgi:PAS domain S-box-containing protein